MINHFGHLIDRVEICEKKLKEIYVMKTLNALILPGVVAFGARPAFYGGQAERCMQAMDVPM
tara:strand:- start:226 stop:411 length:186 start_codon:yes stop_codon:yes gene_type:complete